MDRTQEIISGFEHYDGNYYKFQLDGNWKVGSRIKENYGGNKQSNIIYEIKEITDNTIVCECINVVKPTISQEKRLNKLIGSTLEINIANGGTFAKYVDA